MLSLHIESNYWSPFQYVCIQTFFQHSCLTCWLLFAFFRTGLVAKLSSFFVQQSNLTCWLSFVFSGLVWQVWDSTIWGTYLLPLPYPPYNLNWCVMIKGIQCWWFPLTTFSLFFRSRRPRTDVKDGKYFGNGLLKYGDDDVKVWLVHSWPLCVPVMLHSLVGYHPLHQSSS